ncbi:MAG TPA: spore coat protein CotJB [Ruminiclostridium sp.]|nr:spore coat protein CotJB [Ruminiclostridium sp.]
MNEREMLLRKINTVDFAMYDLHLYLDTHPNDTEALALHEKYGKQREILVAQYTSKYGPLSMKNVTTATHWQWVSNPWPWDYTQEADSNVGL